MCKTYTIGIERKQTTMSVQEKLAMLEDMLDLDENSLEADMNLDEVDGWDSMAKLSLIVLLDDEFEKVITAAQVKELQTVQDILSLMEA